MTQQILWAAQCTARINQVDQRHSHTRGGYLTVRILFRNGYTGFATIDPKLFRLIADNLRPFHARGKVDYDQADARRVKDYLLGRKVRVRIECIRRTPKDWDLAVVDPRYTVLESAHE